MKERDLTPKTSAQALKTLQYYETADWFIIAKECNVASGLVKQHYLDLCKQFADFKVSEELP